MKPSRCAIYTRKSTEEGLEQDFNSLDAQREACSAYVASQKGEGWLELPNRYDDGGFSGGNMDRPGLVRLLADIEAGRVDVVVVYKVDRLTRSLSDFARIVERFDRCNVSFVSVTQAFNTTTSMGRLTLNVLLSFAQFEREVTGERIRDKIAASKKKGMWMGGNAPFGYLPVGRSLKIEPSEAEIVRWCHARYLELGSVHALEREMKAAGIVSRVRTSKAGNTTGGRPFSRGAVFHLLRNRLYVGEIVHRDRVWPGLHPPILDRPLFDAVQAALAKQVVPRQTRAKRSPAVLTGLINDAHGAPMSPVTASRGEGRWRYYVTASTQQGARRSDLPSDGLHRIAAAPVEQLVAETLRDLIGQPTAPWPELRPLITRVQVHPERVAIGLTIEAAARAICPLPPVASEGSITLNVPVVLKHRSGRAWLESAGPSAPRRRPDRILIAALRRAHAELAKVGVNAAAPSATSWRDVVGINDSYLRRLVPLAFLAPDIQEAIMDGRQPVGLTLQSVRNREIPMSWDDQREQLGFQRD
ncbi:recombinase family protein [uncultured Brevundimonas sp.]|uniref:recombinase family protein n=2 Tax=uncultured Brevundimonas sp. TaxID=213418 RepID=UPI0025D81631|nr:recombinase family protein [uncultured Brevundimonas sp.]